MAIVQTSTSSVGNPAMDTVSVGTEISAANFKKGLDIFNVMTTHTHSYTDTYAQACNCSNSGTVSLSCYLPHLQIWDTTTSSGSSTGGTQAGFVTYPNGKLQITYKFNSGSTTYINDAWMTNSQSADGTAASPYFSIRVRVVSQDSLYGMDPSSSDLNNWLTLSTSRVWKLENIPPGSQATVILHVEIRNDTTTAIQASCQITLSGNSAV